ncbi:type III secretion system export apparatus subunit SctR [Caulobacter endophyticus]|uniref:type III secretion system export apparatus subunit SctR n=1 Tax=Caulobacter endophyticus TaxID=2172652 RepID=UPI0024104052|nr:type III secretion system export apparatus subunit SctR [Caulobacter endophyticus]MDG2528520.1 type III secretion system export apparatus subunit SctR [Caulobacter endophyticus]
MDLTQFSPGSALITVILLALAPFVAVMVTSFTKIVVTLSLLRNALGLQQVPPNIVLNGLALILTLYVMYPVGQQMAAANQDIKPIAAVSSDTQALFTYADKAKEPLREFLIKHSTPRERAFFLKTAQRINGPEKARALTQRDFIVVVPAFTVSELAAAFQIGFLIFLPFLIIDLVVSNILLAMGMMMLSPTTVSLPFKLLLFVLIDGWVKLSHGLVLSYT